MNQAWHTIFENILTDLGMEAKAARFLEENEPEGIREKSPCLVVNGDNVIAARGEKEGNALLASLAVAGLAEGGCLLLSRQGEPRWPHMAAYRNSLWPLFHVPAVYRFEEGCLLERLDLNGIHRLETRTPDTYSGYALAAIPRKDALNPHAVTEKFDRNATGWNGVPGSPSYAHFRWMRRIMAEVAEPLQDRVVLDAGCGAGWVGIEAALMGAKVSLFDPSPEMVRIVEQNAADNGVEVDARVGFGEEPPFDGPFDTVISSGVVSFSPDQEGFVDGLDSMLKPGGTLVIGDINRSSWGMGYRRTHRPVLPLRELNALTRKEVIRKLRTRGYNIEKTEYYQLTLPVPLLMHISEQKFKGLGSSSLLLLNRMARRCDAMLGSFAGGFFDSYIVRARKGAPSVA